jgi:hypothetical protein
MQVRKPDDSTTPTRGQLIASEVGQLDLKSWLANRLVVGVLGFVMHRLQAVHIGCAIAMAASALIAFIGNAMGIEEIGGWSGLLLVELVCTYAFGISWLLKGAEISDNLVRLGLCGNQRYLRQRDVTMESEPGAPLRP